MQDIYIFLQNHLLLSLALIVILLLLIALEFIKIKQGATRLSPMQATQMINHQNAVIVDIRSADAFATGHIVGAMSLPLADLQKSKKIAKLKAQPIVLICATGTDSSRAASLLKKTGFDVHIIAGGINAWRAAEMPLVKN